MKNKMAKAYQCDKCKKCYPKEVDYDKQTLKIHNLGLPLDLCDECYEQLVTWFDDFKEEKNDDT